MTSINDKKTTIVKLKGASNYEVWALRIDSVLIKEGLKEAIINSPPNVEQEKDEKALADIRLLIEDGPLLQIQHITSAKGAWDSLKTLYGSEGFISEFLTCREFFSTTLDKYSSMEEYLNKVKQLSDQLKAKKLELPKQVVIAWVLNNLTDEYEGLVSNITQTLRNNIESFTLESLFSNLLDESKRQENKESNVALFTYNNKRYKGKKPYKITKGKFCKHCKLPSHEVKDCYFLFPHKAPKSWNKTNNNNQSFNKSNKYSNDENDENIDVLHSNTHKSTKSNTPEIDQLDLEEDYEFEDIQVLNTIYNNDIITNPLLDKLIPSIEYLTHERSNIDKIKVFNTLVNNNYTANFILDCAATRHVISNKEYFSSIRPCSKEVNWGNAKSINIKGIGDVIICFIDTKLKCVLKNCLYMPELGINLISQGELNKETFTILTYKHIIIKQKDKTITKGEKLRNLYYLPIKVINNKVQILNTSTNSSNNNNNFIWHQRLRSHK